MRFGSEVATDNFLFQTDVLAPTRYLATFHRRIRAPEEQLMLAVLEDAVLHFQKYLFVHDRKGQILLREAEDWFMGEGDGLFSFNDICEVVKLDSRYIRQGLLRWKSGARNRMSAEKKGLKKTTSRNFP
jgi:hypothetical protein